MTDARMPSQPFAPRAACRRDDLVRDEPHRERFQSMFHDRIFALPVASGGGAAPFADPTGRYVVRDRTRKDTAQYAETKLSHDVPLARTRDAGVPRPPMPINTRRADRERP